VFRGRRFVASRLEVASLVAANMANLLNFCCPNLEGDKELLFRGFLVAGVVASVKANFVSISGEMKAGTTMVLHRGGRHDSEFGAKWSSDAMC
jgi:hypothetical protein